MSNIQPYIILNGTDSRSISGLLISSLPPISKPQVRTQVETVDGRDGDIVTPLGFSAYDKVISIGLTYDYDIDEIIEYFNSDGVIIFSNEPDKYYRYAIYEQIDFERLIRFKTAEVTLHCQPFKFSTTEDPKLFNVVSGQSITVKNDGNIDSRPNLTIIGSGDIDLSLNGSQVLSMELTDNQAVIIDSEDMNAYAAQSAIQEVIAEIKPVQAGSGDPSPENIREIIGFTECNVIRAGANLWDGITEDGVWKIYSGGDGTKGGTAGYIRCPDLIPVKPNTTYHFHREYNITDNRIGFYDVDKNYLGYDLTLTMATATDMDITVPSNAYFMTFYFKDNALGNASINYPSTDTTYHAYNGSIYNIAFTDGENPLTVYGGNLNVTTGELTVTYILLDLGTKNWYYDSNAVQFFSQALSDNKTPANEWDTDVKCSAYPIDTRNHSQLATAHIRGINRGDNRIYLINEDYTDEGALKASLSGTQFIYELATPIVYQLTPTQINNLLGLNQMYCDTGNITVKHKSNGVVVTNTGAIVSFDVGVEDMEKGILLNRLVSGDYDKIRLKKGNNTLVLTGNAQQLVVDKYSRWI